MISLTTQAEAEALLAQAEPVWIFKHSATCPVSSAAEAEILAFLGAHPMSAGMVVVQSARPVSNWLATRLGYVHQSPQLFLIAEGKVRWQASHWGITQTAMRAALGR
jgi:bacillithiol system protein YtxJ